MGAFSTKPKNPNPSEVLETFKVPFKQLNSNVLPPGIATKVHSTTPTNAFSQASNVAITNTTENAIDIEVTYLTREDKKRIEKLLFKYAKSKKNQVGMTVIPRSLAHDRLAVRVTSEASLNKSKLPKLLKQYLDQSLHDGRSVTPQRLALFYLRGKSAIRTIRDVHTRMDQATTHVKQLTPYVDEVKDHLSNLATMHPTNSISEEVAATNHCKKTAQSVHDRIAVDYLQRVRTQTQKQPNSRASAKAPLYKSEFDNAVTHKSTNILKRIMENQDAQKHPVQRVNTRKTNDANDELRHLNGLKQKLQPLRKTKNSAELHQLIGNLPPLRKANAPPSTSANASHNATTPKKASNASSTIELFVGNGPLKDKVVTKLGMLEKNLTRAIEDEEAKRSNMKKKLEELHTRQESFKSTWNSFVHSHSVNQLGFLEDRRRQHNSAAQSLIEAINGLEKAVQKRRDAHKALPNSDNQLVDKVFNGNKGRKSAIRNALGTQYVEDLLPAEAAAIDINVCAVHTANPTQRIARYERALSEVFQLVISNKLKPEDAKRILNIVHARLLHPTRQKKKHMPKHMLTLSLN